MCSELGRWLRIAGYDTDIVETSLPDRKIFQSAIREGRFLLTRDKFFKEIDPEGRIVIYLKGESLEGWADQLKKEAGVDWLYRPFSRCLQCNSLLEKTIPPVDQAPKHVDEFWSCPACHHLFWRGSHTERMMIQLQKWSANEKKENIN